MVNEVDCIELELACVDVCTTPDRGLGGKRLDDLNNSVRCNHAVGHVGNTSNAHSDGLVDEASSTTSGLSWRS